MLKKGHDLLDEAVDDDESDASARVFSLVLPNVEEDDMTWNRNRKLVPPGILETALGHTPVWHGVYEVPLT